MAGEEEKKSIEYEIIPGYLRNSMTRPLSVMRNLMFLLLMKLIEVTFLKYLGELIT